jgi:hypothetical protein
VETANDIDRLSNASGRKGQRIRKQVSHEGFREIIYTIGWKIHKKQLPFAVKKDGN